MRQRLARILIAALFALAIHPAAQAKYLDTDFVKKHGVLLAQFLAGHPEISFDDLLRMEVMLATDTQDSMKYLYGPGRPPIQLYILYSQNKAYGTPAFYYFIDRNMKTSQDVLYNNIYGDDGLIPTSFWPEWLVDSEVRSKDRSIDTFVYADRIDLLHFDLRKLRTDNGYQLTFERNSLHGPRGLLDHPDMLELTQFPEATQSSRPRSKSESSGRILVTELYTMSERQWYQTQQELALIQRTMDPEFHASLKAVFDRTLKYADRLEASQREATIRQLMSRMGESGDSDCGAFLASIR